MGLKVDTLSVIILEILIKPLLKIKLNLLLVLDDLEVHEKFIIVHQVQSQLSRMISLLVIL